MKNAAEIYKLDKEIYKKFPEEQHCIYRSLYDSKFIHYHKTLRSKMEEYVDSGKDGYSRVDLALAAAAWTVNKHMPFAYEQEPEHSPQDYIPLNVKNREPNEKDPIKLSQYIKKAAIMFGASEVGITKLNLDWLYSTKVVYSTAIAEKQDVHKFPEAKIPEDMKYAVVMAIEMEPDGFRCAPTFLEFASAGLGYSKMSFAIACVAQFIRNLGYKAYPCANDTGLSVPMAIDAGLGALGRIGLLVTKKYGPRVRLCKVLTNMPLINDGPDEVFIEKVTQFCKTCNKCAEVCDYKAITQDSDPSYETKCLSNNPGVKKWYNDVEKCYGAWVDYSSDCGKCIQVCPFSKIKSPLEINSESFWKI